MENILPRGRRLRLANGLILFVFAVSVTVWLMKRGATTAWFSIVFVLLLLAAVSLLQARDKTCVVLAARGTRETEQGIRPITDPNEVWQLKAQAARVYKEALAIAVVAIAVVMLARGLLAAYIPPMLYGE
jgi:hypothetical protein